MAGPEKISMAFFDFACCEGCQLTVLELNEKLLELMERVEFVEWRETASIRADSVDVSFCEGSVTREEDIPYLRQIREKSRVLVSLGTCASIGCHNALKNDRPMNEALEIVYGAQGKLYDTIPARPITAVVPVDYQAQGCPVSMPELLQVMKKILAGRRHHPSNQPVCVECKLKDNLCVYEKGILCLGPLTRCGCNAICTTFGGACKGCRGLMDQANIGAMTRVLNRGRLHAIMDRVARENERSVSAIRDKYAVYNNWPGLTLEEVFPHA
jgi:coenzyme F420-reducing hydrogenase gamma subunit